MFTKHVGIRPCAGQVRLGSPDLLCSRCREPSGTGSARDVFTKHVVRSRDRSGSARRTTLDLSDQNVSSSLTATLVFLALHFVLCPMTGSACVQDVALRRVDNKGVMMPVRPDGTPDEIGTWPVGRLVQFSGANPRRELRMPDTDMLPEDRCLDLVE